MSIIQTKTISTGLFFLFIFLSGYWLSRSGKPYSVLVFTIHKLIGLAAGIFLIMTIYRIHQAAPLSLVEIMAIGVTVLLFVVTVTAGGLLSTEKSMPIAISILHKLFPYTAVLSTAVTLYLLIGRK
jgi:hypothetical protein